MSIFLPHSLMCRVDQGCGSVLRLAAWQCLSNSMAARAAPLVGARLSFQAVTLRLRVGEQLFTTVTG